MEGGSEDLTRDLPLSRPTKPNGLMTQGKVPCAFLKTGPCPYKVLQLFTFTETNDLFQIPFCSWLALPE